MRSGLLLVLGDGLRTAHREGDPCFAHVFRYFQRACVDPGRRFGSPILWTVMRRKSSKYMGSGIWRFLL